jgi:hypothetical protein
MDQLLGTTVPVFIGMTFVLFGFAAFMTGQALANGWQPVWKAVPYGIMMGVGNRFLVFALFDGELLSFSGLVIAAAVLVAMTAASHRMIQARKMVSQYPWLYESAGLFNWRQRGSER